MSWATDPLAARRAEREELLARARDYVERLSETLALDAAAVGGSVARGDFNVWSDVDVVVVSDALPPPGPRRAALLASGAGPRIEPHGYTRVEFSSALRRRDRLVQEVGETGVALVGSLPR